MNPGPRLTPSWSDGYRRGPAGCGGGGGGGGGGDGGGLIPGQVAGRVVGLTEGTPPPVVEVVAVGREPVLVLYPWVAVCGQHLWSGTHIARTHAHGHTRTHVNAYT